MQLSHSSANNNAPNMKLPPISNGTGDGAGDTVGVGADDTKNTNGAAIQRAHVTGKSQQMIYRSIPPKVQNFTFSDMLDNANASNSMAKKPKGAIITSSSEFAKRFMSRPTTQPKVIDFKPGAVKVDKRRRGINGFFPPVKLRLSSKKDISKDQMTPEVKTLYIPTSPKVASILVSIHFQNLIQFSDTCYVF